MNTTEGMGANITGDPATLPVLEPYSNENMTPQVMGSTNAADDLAPLPVPVPYSDENLTEGMGFADTTGDLARIQFLRDQEDFLLRKWERAQQQMTILEEKISDLCVRKSRADAADKQAFGYSYWLQLSTLRKVNFMFFNYQCHVFAQIEEIQQELEGAAFVSVGDGIVEDSDYSDDDYETDDEEEEDDEDVNDVLESESEISFDLDIDDDDDDDFCDDDDDDDQGSDSEIHNGNKDSVEEDDDDQDKDFKIYNANKYREGDDDDDDDDSDGELCDRKDDDDTETKEEDECYCFELETRGLGVMDF